MHMRLTATLAMTLLSGMAFAGGARSDLTAEDLARVRAVTAPTTDFSEPENFEQMSGGGATINGYTIKPVN